MAIDIIQISIAVLAATVIWFFVGALVYMNPFVDNIYKKLGKDPTVKDRGETKTFLVKTFVFSILIQCILFAIVYVLIKPILSGSMIENGLYFGSMLVAIKIIPRYLDMWMQSNYPLTLLNIEIINGAIGSYVIAFVFALLL